MHFDLPGRCRKAREHIIVPAFPLESIRAAAERAPETRFSRRSLIVTLVAGVSLVAIGAAAQVMQQAHIRFVTSGGMVITGEGKSRSLPIHSDEEIQAAAANLDFPVVLPAGLPKGSRPIRLYTSGTSLIAVTYALPAAHRGPRHLLWIFIAKPSIVSGKVPAPARSVPHGRMSQAHWRAGAEEVIAVYSGLTAAELSAIKRAMTPAH